MKRKKALRIVLIVLLMIACVSVWTAAFIKFGKQTPETPSTETPGGGTGQTDPPDPEKPDPPIEQKGLAVVFEGTTYTGTENEISISCGDNVFTVLNASNYTLKVVPNRTDETERFIIGVSFKADEPGTVATRYPFSEFEDFSDFIGVSRYFGEEFNVGYKTDGYSKFNFWGRFVYQQFGADSISGWFCEENYQPDPGIVPCFTIVVEAGEERVELDFTIRDLPASDEPDPFDPPTMGAVIDRRRK